MRSLFFLFFFFSSIFAVSAGNQDVVCTMEYEPVCGQPRMNKCETGMYCIQLAPDIKTYGNICSMKADGATLVGNGACDSLEIFTKSEDSSRNAPGMIVGNDIDKNGCKASAGYQWNKIANKCIRPWESKIRTFTIGPRLIDCVGIESMKCMQMKNGIKWKNFYSTINGFEYISGYTYRIQVIETKIENPGVDESDRSYEFIKVLSKKPTAKTLKETLIYGDWKLQSYNSKKVSGDFTAHFASKKASFKFCNQISGEYKLSERTFFTGEFLSTMMYCEGIAMILEDNFKLDGAIYTLISTKSLPAQHILTITTQKGDVYVYRK